MVRGDYAAWSNPSDVQPVARTLAEWLRISGPPDDLSSEGTIRCQGGDLVTKLQVTPDRITPADFRLRPDNAGYRVRKDGKDLGADVDLVGPGPAPERWKKTPEYRQWLMETERVRKRARLRPRPAAGRAQSPRSRE